jgi:GT2 family glycosyltransferase
MTCTKLSPPADASMGSGIVRDKIVVLGMMTKMPVAGVVWQTVHYLLGLERLGFETYYVEAHARTPSMLMSDDTTDGSEAAAGYISAVMRRFGLRADRWAYQALHSDGRTHGISNTRLSQLYRDASLIINLHGGTEPRHEHAATGRLIYVETDPVTLQIELAEGRQSSTEFLEPHVAFFTFGENLGRPGCALPVSERFPFLPTRQPVVLDQWRDRASSRREVFTTIGNWRQAWRDVAYAGETYRWSKHHEFMKFLDLPGRTGIDFELALASLEPSDRELLERHGWKVVDALPRSRDVDTYRDYICSSRGEFTVAKDQNVRFRSGWFSDRSATYLAAGRPVVTQDTGFGDILPTGRGLFAFSTAEDAVQAFAEIERDPGGHERAASEIANAWFSHETVLGELLRAVGLPGRGATALIPIGMDLMPRSRRPLVLPEATDRTLKVVGEPAGMRLPQTDAPSVSVIVLTSDNLPILRLCIAAIFANTERFDWELVVVDNGSRDGTEIYLRKLLAAQDRVTVVSNSHNRGFAAGVNQGLGVSKCDRIVLLNDDAIVTPGWLDGLLPYLEDPAVAAVGPVTNRISNEAQIETSYQTYEGALAQAAACRQHERGASFEIAVLAMYCFVTRRDVVKRLGPLDERFEIGTFEDDDYSRRIQESGYRLVCATDVFVHHFGEASLGKLAPSGDYARLLAANRQRFEEKWGSPWKPRAPVLGDAYEELIPAVRDSIRRVVPPGETMLVISRGDPQLVQIDGIRARHFPCDASGGWAGYYPADDAEAVKWLVRETDDGARYLAVPATSRWWLDYYEGLTKHLAQTALVLEDGADTVQIYRLASTVGTSSTPAGQVR